MASPQTKVICRIGNPAFPSERFFAKYSVLSLGLSSLALVLGLARLKSVPFVTPAAWLVAIFHHLIQWRLYEWGRRSYIIPNWTRYHGQVYTGNTWVIALLSVICLAGAFTTVASARGGVSIFKLVDLTLAGLDVIEGALLMVVTVLRCAISLEEDPVVLDW